MNPILLRRKYRDLIYNLPVAIKAIEEKDLDLPLRFYPNEFYINNPDTCWDVWENNKYKREMKKCKIYWNKLLSLAKRIKKIENKRINNPLYCNKSDANIKSLYRINRYYCYSDDD